MADLTGFISQLKQADMMNLCVWQCAHQRTVFADYGTILRYGYEEQVPETVKQEMQEGYGWDDNLCDLCPAGH